MTVALRAFTVFRLGRLEEVSGTVQFARHALCQGRQLWLRSSGVRSGHCLYEDLLQSLGVESFLIIEVWVPCNFMARSAQLVSYLKVKYFVVTGGTRF
jgi:hypothetical protein